MTERGPSTGMRGAPDPAEPSQPGASTAPASRPGAPADLGAVRRTDAIIESLAAWRAGGSASRSGPGTDAGRPLRPDDPDPAVRLLRALISDVDDPGPARETGPEPAPPPSPAPSGPGSRRRGPRTIVALGVAGAVLASTGVAVAGGDVAAPSAAAAPPPSTTAGPPGDDGRAADTDAGTHEHPRSPVPTAPERPEPAPKPSGDPADDEKSRPRPQTPSPPGDRPRIPDIPDITVRSTPTRETGDRPTDTRRRLDELHRRAQEQPTYPRIPRDRD